jgi:DNA-binding IclR family transcriptional regulator
MVKAVPSSSRSRCWFWQDEIYESRRSLTAPIRDREGRTVAPINIGAMNSRAGRGRFLQECLPLLTHAAQLIGASP